MIPKLLRSSLFPLSLLALFLLVWGARAMVLLRFGNVAPLHDEWVVFHWVEEKLASGEGSFFLAHNGQLISLYRYCLYFIAERTGHLDHFIMWTAWSVTLGAYAAVIWYSCARVIGKTPLRWVFLAAIAVLFCVPFSGYRSAWVILIFYAQFSLFAWIALALVGFGKGHLSRVLGLLFSAGAALALGVGALVPFAIGVYLLLRCFVEKEGRISSLVWSGIYLAVFALFFLVVPEKGVTTVEADPSPDLGFYRERIDPFLKSGAWPLVFAAPLGILNYLPVALFALVWIFRKGFRNPSSSFVFLGLLYLVGQFAAAAVFRGEAGNNGMPSGRYYHLYLPWLPLVAASVVLLVRALPRARGLGLAAAWGWAAVVIAAVLFLSFFRVGGFLARESGEHGQLWAHELLAELVEAKAEGEVGEALLEKASGSGEDGIFYQMEEFDWWLDSEKGSPHFSKGAAAGIRLSPAAGSEDFVPDGLAPASYGRPPFRYWGSYTESDGVVAKGTFVSEPFETEAASLVFHLVETKKSRIQQYRYPGRSLDLVNEESGERVSITGQLSGQLPRFLRDLPMVAVPVPEPGRYRIEASDESELEWFGFSEPLEAGRATPMALQLAGSGRLLLLAGAGLLAVLLLLELLLRKGRRLESQQENKAMEESATVTEEGDSELADS